MMSVSEHEPSASPNQDLDDGAIEAAHRQIDSAPRTEAGVDEQDRQFQEHMRDVYIERAEKAAPGGGVISAVAQKHAVGHDKAATKFGGERTIYEIGEGNSKAS